MKVNCSFYIQGTYSLFCRQCLRYDYWFHDGNWHSSIELNYLRWDPDIRSRLCWSCSSGFTGYYEIPERSFWRGVYYIQQWFQWNPVCLPKRIKRRYRFYFTKICSYFWTYNLTQISESMRLNFIELMHVLTSKFCNSLNTGWRWKTEESTKAKNLKWKYFPGRNLFLHQLS